VCVTMFTIQGHHYHKFDREVILSAKLLQTLHAQTNSSPDGTDNWGQHN